jgi:hypothetical protein
MPLTRTTLTPTQKKRLLEALRTACSWHLQAANSQQMRGNPEGHAQHLDIAKHTLELHDLLGNCSTIAVEDC